MHRYYHSFGVSDTQTRVYHLNEIFNKDFTKSSYTLCIMEKLESVNEAIDGIENWDTCVFRGIEKSFEHGTLMVWFVFESETGHIRNYFELPFHLHDEFCRRACDAVINPDDITSMFDLHEEAGNPLNEHSLFEIAYNASLVIDRMFGINTVVDESMIEFANEGPYPAYTVYYNYKRLVTAYRWGEIGDKFNHSIDIEDPWFFMETNSEGKTRTLQFEFFDKFYEELAK